VIVNFLSNAVKFSPIGSQIVIQMTESETRPGVPVAPRNVADRDARDVQKIDLNDKKKKSMWSRVRMSQSPERSAECAYAVLCCVCL
jgi:signal transduction histidine kinase